MCCSARIGSLESELDVLQRELLEAREALACQQDEHEGAQSAAAERIAAALGGAQEMQVRGRACCCWWRRRRW